MHSRRSFFMHGGSVVGAVLVVALLSAAAVMIDSSSLAVYESQFAAGGVPGLQTVEPGSQTIGSPATQTLTPSTTTETPAAGTQTTMCASGFDYAVYEESGKTAVACRATIGKCSATPQITVAGQKNPVPCPTPIAKYADKIPLTVATDKAGSRQCGTEWRCKYYHCSPTYKEGCRLMGDAGVGEEIGSKKTLQTAAAKLPGSAGSNAIFGEDGEKEMERISTGEPGFAEALRGTYDSDIKAQQDAIARDEAALRAAQEKEANLRRLAELGQCQSTCQTQLNEASQEVKEIQNRLTRSQEELDRLTAEQSKLEPPSISEKPEIYNCPGGPGCPGGQWNPETRRLENPDGTPVQAMYCVVSCRPLIVHPNRYDASCINHPQNVTGAFLCRNSGDPSDPYSTFGGGSGSGYGAYGAYGARPSGGQPGCNSNQGMGGGGGIFGTIISLVMRGIGGNNNSGCNGSDAPTPSCTITATPRTVGKGQAVTLSWQSERAFSATLSSSGSVAPSGSMTVNPQTTTTYTLQVNGYIENRTGQQLRGQCSTQVIVDGEGGGNGAPKAEISCRPEVADVGMSIAVSFACANSSVSAGNGFSTNNQLSGSATPVIAEPTIGTSNAIFGVTCSKEGKTDTAQCTVAINKTSMVLIANPKNVESGRQANIGWITSGMQECTISSPTLSDFTSENAGNTATSGVAKTPALADDAEFELSCTTKSGVVKTAKTTVEVD
jgi:hypothetical protein